MVVKTQKEGVWQMEQKIVNRHEMTEEQERAFVNKCFDEYEKKGFAETFWTPYDDYRSRIGQKFEVTRRTTEEEADLECLPLWKIKFEDGEAITAHPEEIIASEIANVKKQVGYRD